MKRLATLAIFAVLMCAAPAFAAVGPPSTPIDALPLAVAEPAPALPVIDEDCLASLDAATPVMFDNPDAIACQPQLLASTGRCLVTVPLAAIVTAVLHFAGSCTAAPGLPPRPD